jgi:hypothetical protein
VSACLPPSQERQPSRASDRLPVCANKRLFTVFSCHSGRGAQRVGGCWSTPLPGKRFSARRSPAARPAAATADHKHLLPVPPLVPAPAPPRLPRPLLSSLSPSAAPHDFDALRMCSFDSYYLFPPFLRFAVSLSTHFTTFIALSSCSIALL